MATQSINTTVSTSSHPNIVKRLSVSGIAVSSVLLVVGILVFMSTFTISDHSSALSIGLGVAGISLALWGAGYFFTKSKEEVYTPTNSIVHRQSFFFNLKHFDELKQFVMCGVLEAVSDVEEQQGGNIRMDVVEARDGKFVGVQLLQFVPYTYSPVTSVYYYTDDEALKISSFIESKAK